MLLRSPINLRKHYRSHGFSFVELMFAVMVLGIGFIMIAAVFPVGLQQVKNSLDESAAAANARASVAQLELIGQGLTYYTSTAPNTVANDATYSFPMTFLGTSPTTSAIAAGSSLQVPGLVRSLRDARDFVDAGTMTSADIAARRLTLWNLIAPQLINTSDTRNAVTVLYRRDAIFTNTAGVISAPKPASSAQLIVINAQSSAHSTFAPGTNTVPGDIFSSAPPTIYNLEPRPVGVIIQYDAADGIYTATFSSANAANFGPAANKAAYDAVFNNAIAEGTYIVIADDRITGIGGVFSTDSGRMNGRIFKVGINVSANVWQLAPGYGLSPDPGASGTLDDAAGDDIVAIGTTPNPTSSGTANSVSPVAYDSSKIAVASGPAIAYVLGRGFSDVSTTPAVSSPGGPYTTGSTYNGPTQDVAAYTTFINVP